MNFLRHKSSHDVVLTTMDDLLALVPPEMDISLHRMHRTFSDGMHYVCRLESKRGNRTVSVRTEGTSIRDALINALRELRLV